jgi:hypothetical protein
MITGTSQVRSYIVCYITARNEHALQYVVWKWYTNKSKMQEKTQKSKMVSYFSCKAMKIHVVLGYCLHVHV